MPYCTAQHKSGIPVNLYYEDLGNGDPVVLIHGWPVSHEMWEYQAANLVEAGYRCISYDRRGFGKSDKPWDGYDYSTLATDLEAILEKLKLENVTLVGFSMGGGEAIRYCSLYETKRLSKIILISSIVPYMLKSDTNPNGVPEESFMEMEDALQEDRPAFLASFGETFFGHSVLNHAVSREILNWMQGLALQGSPRATLQCLKSFAQTDFRHELSAIQLPTLIIHGDADKTVPIKPTSEQAANLISGALFKKYEDAPHGLFITDKEELNADIFRFIKDGTVMYDREDSTMHAFIPEANAPIWP